MKIFNLKIKDFISFEPNEEYGSGYKLFSLDKNLISKFKKDIEDIENNKDLMICLRGDSKESQEAHNDFFNKELNSFFIVGNKARSNYQTCLEDDFQFYQGKNKPELIKDLEELIKACNSIVSQKTTDCISGEINNSFLKSLNQKDVKDLEHWRLFFISFLHNNGKGNGYKKFKDYSPFTSLTYGSRKAPTSRNFALKRIKHKTGFIYITVVDTRKKYFIKTQDLISELSRFGVKWYKDAHREYMVLNGVFPHHILGIMEVNRTRTPRLIVNPWLYKEYNTNRTYSVDHGIPINQEHFHDFINNDKFNRYFYENYKGDQYVSEINQSSTKKVNVFK